MNEQQVLDGQVTDEVMGSEEESGDEPKKEQPVPENSPRTPAPAAERSRPFEASVFKSLANPDQYGDSSRHHWYPGSAVCDWQQLRNGKQIDMQEHTMFFGTDGPPLDCSGCGRLFQPYRALVLRGDLGHPDFLEYMGHGSFTAEDLPNICVHHRSDAFNGALLELGSFVALIWNGEVVDEGAFCGTPWFHNVKLNRTFPNSRGCLGETRNAWGDVQARLQTANQINWMGSRFEKDLPTEQLDILAELLDQLDGWTDSEESEEELGKRKDPVKTWKEVTRKAMKDLQAARVGQSPGFFDEKLVDLFSSLRRPSTLSCLSREQCELLIASKAGKSSAGRNARRSLNQRGISSEKKRINALLRGKRSHETGSRAQSGLRGGLSNG